MSEMPHFENFSADTSKPEPIWANSESLIFLDWYVLQATLPVSEQSPEYKTFIEEVEKGNATLPEMSDYDPLKPEVKPVWMYPESDLFLDWYLAQSELPEAMRSIEYRKFLAEVEKGNAALPSIEMQANRKIYDLRHNNKTREE